MSTAGGARRRASALLWAAGILAIAPGAAGQAMPWVSRGPAGGNVYCIAADPTRPETLYAGTGAGVSRSEDGGVTWQPAGTGLPADRVQTIAIDPADPDTLYAGTVTPAGVSSDGIFRSTDGGASWTAVNDGLVDPISLIAPLDVAALAADPSHPGTLLAGTRFSEIFKSTDGGATWQPQTLGGFNLGLETSAIVYDPSDPSTVYAATTEGLLKSVDGGDSWSFFGDANVTLVSLAIDPTSPSTLYAGNATGLGVGKSTDGGATWNAANGNLPLSGSNYPLVLAVAVDPSQPSHVYAATFGNGLFVTTDGGASWTEADAGMRSAYVDCLLFPAAVGTPTLAGTLGGGIYRRPDTAPAWTASSQGLNLSRVSALALDPAPGGTLYASAFDGVHASTDGAVTWQEASAGLPVAPVAAIARSSSAAGRLLAGTLGGGLLASTDGGESWSPSAEGLPEGFVGSLAVNPTAPATVYAGSAHPAQTGSPQRVFRSVDGGATWTQTALDGGTAGIGLLAVDPGNSARVFAASPGAGSYFESRDSGSTWSTVTPDASCGAIFAVLFDSAAPALYLGGSSGVCRSSDGGATWTAHAVADASIVEALMLDPNDATVLYAGAAPAVPGGAGGVFRSRDGGASWEEVGTGLAGANVTSLAFDAASRTLFAGIDGGGVAALSLASIARQPVLAPPSTRGTRPLPPR